MANTMPPSFATGHFSPLKEFSICCGMIPRRVKEVTFGPIGNKSIEDIIITANNDMIVNWLAIEGPYGMMKFILKHRPETVFREKYVCRCHLCSEILTRTNCRIGLVNFE